MSLKIECVCCRECFEGKSIKISTLEIPIISDSDEMMDFADDSGVEFDCPECGERQFLSDCEFF